MTFPNISSLRERTGVKRADKHFGHCIYVGNLGFSTRSFDRVGIAGDLVDYGSFWIWNLHIHMLYMTRRAFMLDLSCNANMWIVDVLRFK